MVDDRHCVVHVSVEAFLQTVHVVVSSAAASLSSLDASLDALVLGTLEEKHEEEVNLLGHLSLPALQVVLVSREAVDKEFVVARLLEILKRCIINR